MTEIVRSLESTSLDSCRLAVVATLHSDRSPNEVAEALYSSPSGVFPVDAPGGGGAVPRGFPRRLFYANWLHPQGEGKHQNAAPNHRWQRAVVPDPRSQTQGTWTRTC